MAKDKTHYSCTECGGTSPKWLGKCPSCNAWNTLIESLPESGTPTKNRFASLAKTAEVTTLGDIDAVDMDRTPTGHEELDRVLGGGRINVRYGTAMGYNPTDYFREGANRSIISVDPNSIRENRMGTVMLRGQTLWQGGSLTALYAPKVADAPDDGDWSADFGSTNNRNRWLLAVSHQLADNLNPQMVLYGDQRQPVQLGLNLAALINDAMLAHLEWSGGRAKSLLAQALPWAPGVAQDEVFRNRLAAGLTYTSASKMSVALEYHYNGAAVDEAQWSALRSDSLLSYGSYRQVVQEQLELTTRHAAFVRATWQDALVNKLDLAAMLRFNLDDSSHLAWLEARYRLNRAEVALQWQLASGDALSDFGALAQRRNIQALFRYYF